MEVEILGSGTSMGVPIAGCDCRVCCSTDSKDKRLRTSALLKIDGTQILIDTSVDYRQQMLRANVKYLNAVIYTHHHVDHILGMDDLRSFNILNKTSIPLYGMQDTMDNIKRVFIYAFGENQSKSTIPRLDIHVIDKNCFQVSGIDITPIPLLHGRMPVFGYRVGAFAYCTDVSTIPESSFERLQDLEVLVLGALRHKPHPTHFSIEQAIEAAQRIGAKTTYFTHIAHSVMHQETEAQLPPDIHLAYDGLKLTF